ncbi:MAG: TonB-dependent receptor [Candidatus Solibacter usitatus]|nr:TonB-dependent receptor [Candidatus Solibacter usitatus]
MRRWLRCLLGIVTLLFLLGGVERAQAQVLYGTVVGTVRDSSLAVVPGAGITLTNQETNQTRTATASAVGEFLFTNVLPGAYTLSIKAQGLQPFSLRDVQVTINTVARVDVELNVGQVTEAVTVSASASVLQADKADVHVELGAREVTSLPLTQYRNYQSLIDLVPGSTPSQLQNALSDTPARALSTNINGTVRSNSNTRVDGGLNKYNIISSHTLYVPPAESIETVNISTNAFDAEQGMAGGAAITVSTKSGTNEFHGAVFAYNQNNGMQARNFFFQGSKTPKSINNTDGVAIGGPIRKNKLFFFGDWEGVRERKNYSQLFTVARPDQREGDFSAYNVRLYDPLTGNADGAGRTLFPDSKIPASRQSAITRKMQALVPLPNLSGTSANFFNAGTQALNRDNYDVKINWNRTDRQTIWGKYSAMDAQVACESALGEGGGRGLCNGGAGIGSTLVQVGTLGYTWVVGPSLVLDATLVYNRLGQQVRGPDFGTNFGLDVLGIPGTNGPDPRQSGKPMFVVSGYETMGTSVTWLPIFRTDETFTYSTNVGMTKSAHDIRFGFDLIRFRQNDWQPSVGGGPRGQFNFTGGETALRGGASPNQYNAYASFLLGFPYSTSKSLQFYSPQTAREWQFGWYFRDRWQATRKLTLTLGLRYEYYPMMTRAAIGFERYEASNNKVYIGRRGGNPDNVGIQVSKKLFAPRVGLAYRINSSTVVRAGYGISIDPNTISGGVQRPYPVAFSSDFIAPNTFAFINPIEQGIPLFGGPDINKGVIDVPLTANTVTLPGGMLHRGYIQSWNLMVEEKLPFGLVGSAGYVGTQTVRQFGLLDLNAGRVGVGLAGRPYYAQYGRSVNTSLFDGLFSGNYHSLQATLNRAFANGLFLKTSYTFGKAVNYTDDTPGAASGALMFNTPEMTARNRAPAGFDRTHNFQLAWVYHLPSAWAKGKGAAGVLFRNWQINGVVSAYSGTSFTVTASGTSLNSPSNTQTADQVKTEVTKLGGIGIGNPWFDPSAFAPVTAVRFGTSGRNILRGPGVLNFNTGLFRKIRVSERFGLDVRAEAFNLANTPHFGNPAANASNPANFMAITSALDDARLIRLGLRLSF